MLVCPKDWFDTEKASGLGMSRDGLLQSLSYLLDLSPLDVSNYSAAEQEFQSIYKRHGFQSLLDYYRYISVGLTELTAESISTNHISGFACRGCKIRRAEKTFLQMTFCYAFYFEPIERGLGVYSATRSVQILFKPKTQPLLAPANEWHIYFSSDINVLFSIFTMLTVRPYYHNFVKFSEQKFISMHSEDAPCSEPGHRSSNYTSPACMAKCHNDLYRARIGCGFLWLSDSHLPPANHCNTLDMARFGNQTIHEFYASTVNGDIDATAAKTCIRQCPLECKRKMYDTALHLQVSYSEEEKARAKKSNMTLLEVVVNHNAVFQGGVLELKEIDTYTITQLVTNFGGTLGLFVGATLMTFAQVVLFIIDRCLGGSDKKETGMSP